MKINCIATGSSGNLYEILDSEGNSFLIEAGVPRPQYVKYRIGKTPPEMCIISHGHSDHAQYRNEYAAITPTHVAQDRNTSEHFKAMGFKVRHGDCNTHTFIIKSLVDDEFLFFGTDMEYDNYEELFNALKKHKVTRFLIECNYNDYLFHMADEEQRRGCIRHMSDNDVVNFMKRVKPENPKIILIHGSNRLSADAYTKKYIGGKLLNATVQIAVGAKNGVKNIFII